MVFLAPVKRYHVSTTPRVSKRGDVVRVYDMYDRYDCRVFFELVRTCHWYCTG